MRRKSALTELGGRIERARGTLPRTVLAHSLGVSYTLVYKWEIGANWPRIWDLLELSRLLGKPLEYFTHGLNGPSVEEALLALGRVTDEDLLAARAYCHRMQPAEPVPSEWRYAQGPQRSGSS